jgi:replicative DNA helicase
MSLLGAQTGHGKTTLGLQFCRYAAAMMPDHMAVFMSPEMRPHDIDQMHVLMNLQRSRDYLRKYPESFDRHGEYERGIATADNLRIADMPRQEDGGLDEFAGRIRELRASCPISLIVVDYAQFLITEADVGRKNRWALAGDIARVCDDIARLNDCAVVLTTQVKTQREKGKIVEIDARESHKFADASAAVIWYVRVFDSEGREQPDEAHFRVVKSRFGTTGKVPVESLPGHYAVREKEVKF